MTRLTFRVALGCVLGIAFVAACAGAAPTTDPAAADELARKGDAGAAAPPSSSEPDGPPKCPFGALEDPHRGFVRCLTPDERDAGWLPPSPQPSPSVSASAAASASPSSEADAGAPTQGPPPAVEIGSPAFENGQVPKVEKALAKLADGVAKCVGDHGGMTAATGSMKVQFLVRARGRAEGVEVLSAKGVSQEAKDCVRLLLKNRSVGAPTADPVGVTVTFSLKPAGAK